jgi:hypothetical protein
MAKKNDFMRQAAAFLGRKGGRAAAKILTEKQRLERARKAGQASGAARAKKGAKR